MVFQGRTHLIPREERKVAQCFVHAVAFVMQHKPLLTHDNPKHLNKKQPAQARWVSKRSNWAKMKKKKKRHS